MLSGISRFIVKKRVFIVSLVLAFTILCVYWVTKINVNYNLSNYLQNDSETAIALKIMEEEFGLAGQAEVMVRDVTVSEAKELQKTIENIEGVKIVNFYNTTSYFLDEDADGVGDALIKIIIDGDDYSENAENVISSIKIALSEYEIYFNGASSHMLNLKGRIESEVPLIMIISVLIVALILFVTSTSWFEPAIFGAVIGISIIMNMGTNYLLGEISYITKSVAAILQLALAMDYSIMLLHQYNDELHKGLSNEDAMIKALTKTISPISASALTTMAGLAAIMLMSFNIGLDIGLVLVKAILCSLLSVFLMMPSLTILFNKQLKFFKHKPLFKEHNYKKQNFSLFLKKTRKVFPILLLIVTFGSYVLQSTSVYNYVEENVKTKGMPNEVVRTFGESNQMLLMLPKAEGDQDYAKQQQLLDYLMSLENNDGNPILKDTLSYVSVLKLKVDSARASVLLDMDADLVNQLFGMYYIDNNYVSDDAENITLKDFVYYLDALTKGEESFPDSIDASDILDEMGDLIGGFKFLIDVLYDNLTAEQLHNMLNGEEISALGVDLSSISIDYVKQLYGMYYYDKGLISDTNITLKSLIDYLYLLIINDPSITTSIDINSLLGDNEVESIKAFYHLINMLSTYMSPEEVYIALTSSDIAHLGIDLGDIEGDYFKQIYGLYYYSKGYMNNATITMQDFITYLYKLSVNDPLYSSIIDINKILDADELAVIEALYHIMIILQSELTPVELYEALNSHEVSGLGLSLDGIDVNYLRQIYGMYFFSNGFITSDTITMENLVAYLYAVTTNDPNTYSSVDLNSILGSDTAGYIKVLYRIIDLLQDRLTPEQLLAVLKSPDLSALDIDLAGMDSGYFKQIYGLYYYMTGALDGNDSITMRSFMGYLNKIARRVPGTPQSIDLYSVLDVDTRNIIIAFDKLIDTVFKDMTSVELYVALNSPDITNAVAFSITQDELDLLYGWYHYKNDNMELQDMSMNQIIDYFGRLAAIGYGDATGQVITGLATLVLPMYVDDMDRPMSMEEANEILSNPEINFMGVTAASVFQPAYVELVYVLYAFHNTPEVYDLPMSVIMMLEFIVNDVIVPGSYAYNSTIASSINPDTVSMIRTVINIYYDVDLSFNYTQLTNRINTYMTTMDASSAGVTAELIQQAYIVYFASHNMLPITPVNGNVILNFISSILTPNNVNFNRTIYDFLIDSLREPSDTNDANAINKLNSLVSALNVTDSIYNDLYVNLSYKQFTDRLNYYITTLDPTTTMSINSELIEQAYIMFFINNKTIKDTGYHVNDILQYLNKILTPTNSKYNSTIAGFLGDSDAMISSINTASDLCNKMSVSFSYQALTDTFNNYISILDTDNSNTMVLTREMIQQAYIMYFISNDMLPQEKILLNDTLKFVKDILSTSSPYYNNTISTFLMEDMTDAEFDSLMLSLGIANNVFNDLNTPYSYSIMTNKINDYIAAMDSDEGMVLESNMLAQAFILYYLQNDMLPTQAIPVKGAIDYIKSILDINSVKYNSIVANLVGDNLNDFSFNLTIEDIMTVLDLSDSLYLAVNTQFTYTNLASELNSYLAVINTILDEDSQIDELDSKIIQQIYVLKMIENQDMPEDKIEVIDLVSYVFDIVENPVIAGFLDTETKESLDEYKATIALADSMFNGENHSRMIFTFDLDQADEDTFAFIVEFKDIISSIWGDEAYLAGSSVVLYDIKNNFEFDSMKISLVSILAVFLVIGLIFGSLTIPIILVLIIQAAIWISMSMSPLFGRDIYFMSHTIVTCIQMGATIDYGILISNRYRYNRQTMNKFDSMSCALKESIKTILTSGSILTIAGFVIFFVSTSVAISSIGLYLGRGTIVSMLLVIIVLPQLLMLLDNTIKKSTYKAEFYEGDKTIKNGDYDYILLHNDTSTLVLDSKLIDNSDNSINATLEADSLPYDIASDNKNTRDNAVSSIDTDNDKIS